MNRLACVWRIGQAKPLSQLIVVCPLLLIGGCDPTSNALRENRETGPVEASVVPEMLVGALYRGRTGGDEYDDLRWAFDETHFRIVAGERGLPADLVQALLPAEMTGYRIDGRWSVDGEVMTVTEIVLDGKPIDHAPRTLQAMCTPVIRIQAGQHQYMFARGSAATFRSQGEIPPWPVGTTRVSGSTTFDRRKRGWLSVGYAGMVRKKQLITGSATLLWEPDDTGYGSAKSPADSPRFCRLQLNGRQPASMECMALPPGAYLFYAMWDPEPQEDEGKVVVKYERWRLRSQFRAKWVVVADHPLGQVDFDLAKAADCEVTVSVPESDSLQSVFLLPWDHWDSAPPPVDSVQAWEIARWAGHSAPVEVNRATFHKIPIGRYRLFLVKHDQPAEGDDTLIEYRVTHDKEVTVQEGSSVEVSF